MKRKRILFNANIVKTRSYIKLKIDCKINEFLNKI